MSTRHDRPRRPLQVLGRLLLVVATVLSLAVGWTTTNASAGGRTVTITSTLSPADITVAVGTSVTWTAGVSRRHRVRTQSGPGEFDSGNLEPGQSFTFTFTRLGTYPYVDHENESVHGTVTVATSVPAGGG